MNRMICVKCQCQFRPKVNGAIVLDMPPGPAPDNVILAHLDNTVVEMAGFGPYKLWHADLWACPGCSFEIVAGFAMNPFAEHFEKDFAEKLEKAVQTARRLVYDYEKPRPKEA